MNKNRAASSAADWCLPSIKQQRSTTVSATASGSLGESYDSRNPSPSNEATMMFNDSDFESSYPSSQQPRCIHQQLGAPSPFFTSESQIQVDESFQAQASSSRYQETSIENASSRNGSNNSSLQDRDEGEGEGEDDIAVAMRLQREEEESIRLAQQLMAEEAMASYQHMAQDYLRNNAGQFSEADLAALQSAMEDDQGQVADNQSNGGDGVDATVGDTADNRQTAVGSNSGDAGMAYDLMMRLGENLGDVKTERWKFVAKQKIDALPLVQYDPAKYKSGSCESNDCDIKCLICQYDYEKDETLRRLPCGHCFHQECVDEWLHAHDSCPYCKQPIHND